MNDNAKITKIWSKAALTGGNRNPIELYAPNVKEPSEDIAAQHRNDIIK
ncbi:hypothetical protein [Borreliella bavariensis]|nr:hypothetical protein [Borreliella bavariensis]